MELPAATAVSPMEGLIDETIEGEEWIEGDWAPDPDEPRYCLCNQVSYGDMVACDNPDVSCPTSPLSLPAHYSFNISNCLICLLNPTTVSIGMVSLRLCRYYRPAQG